MVFNPLASKHVVAVLAYFDDRFVLNRASDAVAGFRRIRAHWLYRARLMREHGRARYPASINDTSYHLLERYMPISARRSRPLEVPEGLAAAVAAHGPVMLVHTHQSGMMPLTDGLHRLGVPAIRPVNDPALLGRMLAKRGIGPDALLPVRADALSLARALRLLLSGRYRAMLVAIDHCDQRGIFRFINPNCLELAARRGLASGFLFSTISDDGLVRVHCSEIRVRPDGEAATRELIEFLAAFDPRYRGHSIRRSLDTGGVDERRDPLGEGADRHLVVDAVDVELDAEMGLKVHDDLDEIERIDAGIGQRAVEIDGTAGGQLRDDGGENGVGLSHRQGP
jgi:hypothetical protein